MRAWVWIGLSVMVGCSSESSGADAGGGGGDAPTASMDAATCTGCVDEQDVCLSGGADNACGYGGQSCQDCGSQVCDDGTCASPPSCGPDNCAGCCDGDSCLPGTSDGQCGTGGYECGVCQDEYGLICVGGWCQAACGPDTCAGCCDGDLCVTGQSAGACGTDGESCSDCGDDTCSAGTCIDTECAESCGGCCSGTTCLGGDSSTACGDSGGACVDCGSSRVCGDGQCVVDPTSRWDVVVVNGELAEDSCDSEPWDSFGGLPDPRVHILTSQGPDVVEGDSTTADNTLLPYWNDVVLADVPARLLQNYFSLTVYDDDALDDDYVGSCAPTLTDELFDDTLLALECSRSCGSSEAGFTVRFRIRPH